MAGGYTIRKLNLILKKTDGKCFYCGGEVTTIDHVNPKANGGQNEIANLVPSCKTCNSSKHTKSLEDFGLYLTGLKYYSVKLVTIKKKKFMLVPFKTKINQEFLNFMRSPQIAKEFDFVKKIQEVNQKINV